MENQKSHLQSELRSLRIECKGINEFNGKEELETLATAKREVYSQDPRLLMITEITVRDKILRKNHTL
jgi:hypothetical protein